MPGHPWIENTAIRRRSLVGGEALRMLATNAAVGVLAGVAAAHIRLGLGMPGHKAMFWIIPVLLARLAYRHPLGATAGAGAAACTSLALGGHLAGQALFLPLVAAAGAVLDTAVLFAERRKLGIFWLIPVLGVAGTAANALCLVKRMLAPRPHVHWLLGLADPWASVVSYAAFGLLSGLTAAILAGIVRAAVARRRGAEEPSTR